jgi:beta-phosphoglucomutase-like phosphatase (HAD superfamily)/GNAT superfamily N-acetyltransferase
MSYRGGMTAVCSRMTARQLPAAAELAAEFLGDLGAAALASHFAAHPALTVTLTVKGAVAGVAFGRPDGHGGATLEGITVDDAHTSHGLGSLLLARFEQAAANAGFRTVSVGSADGYVEHFYLKNGYRQTEYMVVIPDGERELLDLDGLDVVRERRAGPGLLVLNIAAAEGYSPARKAALAARLHASHVSCIFHKPITPRPRVIGGIVFDWNGVLVLDEALHCAAFAQVCASTTGHRLTRAEYGRLCAGLTDAEGAGNLLRSGAARGDVSDLVAGKRRAYAQAAAQGEARVAAGTIELLKKLSGLGIPYRVVTASELAEVHAIREQLGLQSLLPDASVQAGVESASRPLALSRARAELPGDRAVLLVDDSEDNILLGSRLGMLTARVHPQPGSCVTAADFCVQTVSDLSKHVTLAGARGA